MNDIQLAKAMEEILRHLRQGTPQQRHAAATFILNTVTEAEKVFARA